MKWPRKQKQEIEYGLFPKKTKGYVYFADGRISGFPFAYSLFAISIRRAEPTEDTTILHKQVVSEILRLERREPHKRAIYALWFYRSPNVVIRLIATSASGKQIALLDEALYISVPSRDTITLIRRLCEGLGAIASGLYTDTKELDPLSRRTIREALLYGSPRTNQFWINATIATYVCLTQDPSS